MLLFVQSAFGQDQISPQEQKVRNEVQKRGVGERSKVKVELLDGTKIKGHISRVDTDSFEVTDSKTGAVSQIRFADAKKVGSQGLSTKAKVWIGVGIAVGIAVAILASIASAYGELMEGL